MFEKNFDGSKAAGLLLCAKVLIGKLRVFRTRKSDSTKP